MLNTCVGTNCRCAAAKRCFTTPFSPGSGYSDRVSEATTANPIRRPSPTSAPAETHLDAAATAANCPSSKPIAKQETNSQMMEDCELPASGVLSLLKAYEFIAFRGALTH
ncbi:hypothetical protein L596_027953 [Steinernema carpocapsae]|uniref:Uncharacterized protein n=1 Tax=Steinernema carpocapsae TaxID=34508 RepID=A0A4U5LX27_STECR|nr:hypothetical protein L596_027953 [Steinernema carpocapsae]